MSIKNAFLLLTSFLSISSAAVWPKPVTFTNGTQVLWLDPEDVQVSYQSSNTSLYSRSLRAQNSPSSAFEIPSSPIRYPKRLTSFSSHDLFRRQAYSNGSSPAITDIIPQAIMRMEAALFQSSLTPWKFYPKNAAFEPSRTSNSTTISSITIALSGSLNTTNTTAPDESYSISISTSGNVLISANSQVGGVRALDTFTQLFYQTADPTAGIYTPLAPVYIKDSPAFAHRGLNLDISRNYMAPKDVIRTLDAMAFNKLNRLHLHASDAQSWPLEIPALPELSQKGAYESGLAWSVMDLQQVQTYGAYRGIQVYLEIDTPGHTAAIALAYPDLIAAFNEQPWSPYSAEPPSGQLKLDSPDVTKFITTLLTDLLPRVSPFSSLFHTGGDEINAEVYTLDPTVGSNSTSVIQPLLQAFVNNAHGVVRSFDMTPVVWEETLLTWNLTLPSDTIIQTWQGQTSLDAVIAKGHKALFGSYDYWYLDCGYGQWLDPNKTNAQTPIAPPYTDYCSPMKNWREVYSYDPTQNYTATEKQLIVGGEVHMFGELTDPVNLDGKLWPRAAAAAEVMWSGPVGPAGVEESVTRRLAEMRERLVLRGVQANMVQMTWCLQNIGDCSL